MCVCVSEGVEGVADGGWCPMDGFVPGSLSWGVSSMRKRSLWKCGRNCVYFFNYRMEFLPNYRSDT